MDSSLNLSIARKLWFGRRARLPAACALAAAACLALLLGSRLDAAPFPISSFSGKFGAVTPNPTTTATTVNFAGGLDLTTITPAAASPFTTATTEAFSINLTGPGWQNVGGDITGDLQLGALTLLSAGGSTLTLHFAANAQLVYETASFGGLGLISAVQSGPVVTGGIGTDFNGYLAEFVPGSTLGFSFTGFTLLPNGPNGLATGGEANISASNSQQAGYSYTGDPPPPVPEPTTLIQSLGGVLTFTVPAAVRRFRRKRID